MLFPDIRGSDFARSPAFEIVRSSVGSTAGDQTRTLNDVNWEFLLAWNSLSDAEAAQLQEAVLAMAGPWGRAYWFEWHTHAALDAAVGTGNGVTTGFNIPGKSTSAQTFKVAGSTTGGTVTPGAGTNGEDTVTFASAPDVGTAITASFTGRRRRTVTLSSDATAFIDRAGSRWTAQVGLIEVPA